MTSTGMLFADGFHSVLPRVTIRPDRPLIRMTRGAAGLWVKRVLHNVRIVKPFPLASIIFHVRLPSPMNDSAVAERFLRYVTVDTQSDPSSSTVPSTEKQKNLSRMLVEELREAGLADAEMDEHGYVYATLPPSPGGAPNLPVVALLAHVDTSPDAPGDDVQPIVHEDYDGGAIDLPGGARIDPERSPALREHVGHDLITSDGRTLLGSDDKAGVAIIMQLAADLVDSPAPRPLVRICFTVDEEIGKGVDHLDLDRLGADVAYTLDGSGVDTIYAETFHAAEATLTVQGVTVHPGYAKDRMANAGRILAEMVAAFPSDEAPETTAHREGYFHPHTWPRASADAASAKILLRDFSRDGMQRRKDLLNAIVESTQRRHQRAQIDLQITDQYENMRAHIERIDPRVVAFAHAAADRMGLPLTDDLVRGGTDGARLSAEGLPTPNLFTGGHDFHSRFEWNTVQNLERSLAFTRGLLAYWCEHGADTSDA